MFFSIKISDNNKHIIFSIGKIRIKSSAFQTLIYIWHSYKIRQNNWGISPINGKKKNIKKYVRYIANIIHPFNKQKRREFRDFFSMRPSQNFTPAIDFDATKIPIYIISFNRLSYIQQMIEWLEKYGLHNIHIIDNASTYPPLLEYLTKTPYKVHYMTKNFGHRVFWECGQFDEVIKNSMYILSDPDIAPNKALPNDFIFQLYCLLGYYKNITKAGFALQIDNLPNTEISSKVKKWESQFWTKPLSNKNNMKIFHAPIDTTFALYRPGKIKMGSGAFFSGIRVAGNYSAVHIPWYNTSSLTEEDIFYKKHALKASATWTNNLEKYEKDTTNA